jgi:hypothetical protein
MFLKFCVHNYLPFMMKKSPDLFQILVYYVKFPVSSFYTILIYFFPEIVEYKHKYSINTSHWFLNFLQIMQDCTCKFFSCSTINRKFNIVY